MSRCNLRHNLERTYRILSKKSGDNEIMIASIHTNENWMHTEVAIVQFIFVCRGVEQDFWGK